MTRAMSIVLIVAIALQTVGCSTWKPLALANNVPEDSRQCSMREQVLRKLKEGMAVRIRIREGTRTPVKGRVLECIVEKIGQTTLTLTPVADHIRGTAKREFRLHFTDILNIQYREFHRNLTIFTVGVTAGATVAFLWLAVAYASAFDE